MNTNTKDLYQTLGVNKTANREQIKRAYRHKAKQAHPDKKGNSEEFLAIQLAYDVLGDDARRARYDETGDTGERRQQSPQEKALQGLASLLVQIVESRGADADLVKIAKMNLQEGLRERAQAVKDTRKKAKRFYEASRRITAKNGENLLASVLLGRADSLSREAVAIQEEGEVTKAALEILESYSYQMPEQPERRDGGTINTAPLEELFKMMGQKFPSW